MLTCFGVLFVINSEFSLYLRFEFGLNLGMALGTCLYLDFYVWNLGLCFQIMFSDFSLMFWFGFGFEFWEHVTCLGFGFVLGFGLNLDLDFVLDLRHV